MRFEYFIFLFLILLSSVVGILLYPEARKPNLRKYLISVLAVNIPYLIWDHFVTDRWWYFNSKYITGVKIFKLPVEEILFFFVVPWSSIVLWVNIRDKIKGKINFPIEDTLLLLSFSFCLWAYLSAKWYLFTVSFGLVTISFLGKLSSNFLRSKSLVFFLLIVFLLILIFNGFLTSRPIVLYSQEFLSGVYIFTIPVEDFFYGLILMTFVVFLYEKFDR